MSSHGVNSMRVPGLTLVLVLLALGIGVAATAQVKRPYLRQESAMRAGDFWPDMRIDVNTACEAELTLLPGIGPRLAERIVQDREAHGPFSTLSEMTRVTWIGPVIVERLEPFAMVDADSDVQEIAVAPIKQP